MNDVLISKSNELINHICLLLVLIAALIREKRRRKNRHEEVRMRKFNQKRMKSKRSISRLVATDISDCNALGFVYNFSSEVKIFKIFD